MIDTSAFDAGSPQAALVAGLGAWMFGIGFIVLAVVIVLTLWGLWRGRRGSGPLAESASTRLVVAGGVVVPLVVLLPLVTASVLVQRSATAGSRSPPPGALRIAVEGEQWWWAVHYLDAGGRRIATTANEIHVPVGRPVQVLLTSDNVIHSFWVPSLQGKTDAIPGKRNTLTFTATRAGEYRGQCAEFCGIQHAKMRFLVVAEPAERFREWLDRQEAPAAAPSDAFAAEGRDVFLRSQCVRCHTVRGTPARGELGPDLTHVGGRREIAGDAYPNTAGYLGGWIADPQHLKPGCLMPPTTLEPRELRALVAYLESLR